MSPMQPITDEQNARAQAAQEAVDAQGQKKYSQVRIDPETGAVLARDIADHTKWTRV